MTMPTTEILHQCWGTWCWVQWGTGYQLGEVTPVLHPVTSSSPCQSPGVRTLLLVRQACPKSSHCWWCLWLPSDKRTSQSLACPESHNLSFFFPPCCSEWGKGWWYWLWRKSYRQIAWEPPGGCDPTAELNLVETKPKEDSQGNESPKPSTSWFWE